MLKFREARVLSRDGYKLAVYVWEQTELNNSPICLIHHGMAEYGLRYGRLIEDLSDTGWTFATFDMRGHGRSEGERMRLDDILHLLSDLGIVLKFVRGSLQRKRQVVLLGHSIGGLIVTLYAERNPQDLSGIILSSPAFGLYFLFPFMDKAIELLYHLCPDARVPKPVRPERLSHDLFEQEKYRLDSQIYKFTGIDLLYHMLQGMRYAEKHIDRINVPLLLILAGDDQVVDNRKSLAFFDKIRDVNRELIILNGFCHETFNELRRLESIEHVKHFLKNLPRSSVSLKKC